MASFRDLSRKEWDGAVTSTENISAGSFQRIADACEKMAANWIALTAERDRYKRWYEDSLAKRKALEHRIAGLRGVNTKLRLKLGAEK